MDPVRSLCHRKSRPKRSTSEHRQDLTHTLGRFGAYWKNPPH